MKRREFLSAVGAVAAGGPSLASQAPSIRPQFHLPADYGYFNTAGLGASPRSVTDAVKLAMDRVESAPAPGHSEADWVRIRGKIATLLGPSCRPDEIALISTATEGINVVLNGLPLRQGDEVITSTHEHVALAVPLLHKIRTAGIVVRTFEPDLTSSERTVDRVSALVGPRTRLIFISHVTCTTGQILPVAAIGQVATTHRLWYALDGAQSLAHMPIDIAATGAQFYTASGHKWLLGPKRTGMLFVRRDQIEALVPSIVGAYSDESNSLAERSLTLRAGAQRFEYGTQNAALVYGLEAAVDLMTSLGVQKSWERNLQLANAFREGLRGITRAGLLSPADASARSAIVTFRLDGHDNRDVANRLSAQKLRVRSVTEAGLDAVRASFHLCNDESEVTRLAEAVRRMA
jgi:selenocysteine lyase/cysteine desulfurase